MKMDNPKYLIVGDPCPFGDEPLIKEKEYFNASLRRMDYRLICRYGHETMPEFYQL